MLMRCGAMKETPFRHRDEMAVGRGCGPMGAADRFRRSTGHVEGNPWPLG